ncbi:tRNA-dihydrouridine synthase A [Plasmodium gonderi]|uniref:tRNA-dihydrouridine synthase A n=1 Tax=Plasmodium gonderi TaxID=77519 RepID=A0A1Y1JCK9_PLAGO|nr:tRNA-dihydrouridine synthase A [Plasmodium gonderi]GAW80251.1 tRNA-dihydrouridine synthase A [Plasmodium gonderi]
MQIKLLGSLTICLYFILLKNHGKSEFKIKIYTHVGVYYIEAANSPTNINNLKKKKLWLNKKGKRNLYCFNHRMPICCYANKVKKRKKLKKNAVMSIMTENNVQEVLQLCENVFKFEDISTSLGEVYVKRKHESTPFIQVAPMINVTNRYFRALVRIITKRAQLWTEMVVDNTLLYNLNNLEEYLGFNNNEHPIVCQLGGSDATSLSEAAILVEQAGYDEININIGCPSMKVANKGAFGAYLMKKPEDVRNIIYEIKKKVQIPVSVKIRTGVDDYDSFSFLKYFIETVSSVGCNHFIVHARKAWLKGLDPKQNRSVPPLEYQKVYALCQLYPHLKFTLNGGVKTIEEAIALLNGYIPRNDKLNNEKNYVQVQNYHINPLNGVMLGRACMENTTVLSQTDKLVYNQNIPTTAYSRRTVLDAYKTFLEENSTLYTLSSAFEYLKPVLGILKGMPGHRIFRNKLDVYIRNYASTLPCSDILEKAMEDVDIVAPGCLDIPLGNYQLQQEYINNY